MLNEMKVKEEGFLCSRHMVQKKKKKETLPPLVQQITLKSCQLN